MNTGDEAQTNPGAGQGPTLLALRMAEAMVFASPEPVSDKILAAKLPDGVSVAAVMAELQRRYRGRGVNLLRTGDAWAFRTADDLAFLFAGQAAPPKKLSRAAVEALAVIAYHQPVTRAEMEEIRGVETSRGTLDLLLETGWVKMRGRRRSPGRPVTYGTTPEFLDHFGLVNLRDLPGLDELKGAGLLAPRLPTDLSMPFQSRDAEEPAPDEDPLTDIDLQELGLLALRDPGSDG